MLRDVLDSLTSGPRQDLVSPIDLGDGARHIHPLTIVFLPTSTAIAA